MRDRPLRQSVADRCHHANVLEHHRRVLARRARRDDDERIVGTKKLRELVGRMRVQQIDFLAAEPEHGVT